MRRKEGAHSAPYGHEEMQSDKLWQEKLAASAELLRAMAKEALAEDEAGETEELDPDSL